MSLLVQYAEELQMQYHELFQVKLLEMYKDRICGFALAAGAETEHVFAKTFFCVTTAR